MEDGKRSTEDTGSKRAERMLADVPLDEEVVLVRMDVDGEDIEALLERGIVPGCKLCPVRHAPAGGATVYRVDGDLIAMRKDTASCLCVQNALAARRSASEGRRGAGQEPLEPAGVADPT